MEALFLLIPLSLVLVGVIVWAFLWAVGAGQFEDLEGPAYRVVFDEQSGKDDHIDDPSDSSSEDSPSRSCASPEE